MDVLIPAVWLGVWVVATIWSATWGFEENAPPPFLWVLMWGWAWPVVVVLAAIIGPLMAIAERANRLDAAQNKDESNDA